MKNKTLADATMEGVKKQYSNARKVSNLSIRSEIFDLRREQITYVLSTSSLFISSVDIALIGSCLNEAPLITACYILSPILAISAITNIMESSKQIKMNNKEIKKLKEQRTKTYESIVSKINVPTEEELEILEKCNIKYLKKNK